jgi:hypothetical protein
MAMFQRSTLSLAMARDRRKQDAARECRCDRCGCCNATLRRVFIEILRFNSAAAICGAHSTLPADNPADHEGIMRLR